MEKFGDRFLLVLAKLKCSLGYLKVILLGLWSLKSFNQLFHFLDKLVQYFFIRLSIFLKVDFQLLSQLSVNSIL